MDKREGTTYRTTSAEASQELRDYLQRGGPISRNEAFEWRFAGQDIVGDTITRRWSATATEAALTLQLCGQTFTTAFYGTDSLVLDSVDPFDKVVDIMTRADHDAVQAALDTGTQPDAPLRHALAKPALLAGLAESVRSTQDNIYKNALQHVVRRGATTWNIGCFLGMGLLGGVYALRSASFTADWLMAAVVIALWTALWAFGWPVLSRRSLMRVVDGPGRNAAHVQAIDQAFAMRGFYRHSYTLLQWTSLIFVLLIPVEGVYKRYVEHAKLAQIQAEEAAEARRGQAYYKRLAENHRAEPPPPTHRHHASTGRAH